MVAVLKGHSWQAKVYSRSAGSGCPYCTGRKEVPENSLAVQVPSLEAEWDTEKKRPAEICRPDHRQPQKRSGGGALRDIPTIRSSRAVCWAPAVPSVRDVLFCRTKTPSRQGIPHLLPNGIPRRTPPLLPTLVAPGTVRKAWWRCPKGAQLPCRHLIPRGWWNRLPILHRAKVIQGENDLATQYPQLAAQWDRQKKRRSDTGGSDFRLQPPRGGAAKKGHSYPAVIAHRVEWKRLSVLLQPQRFCPASTTSRR